VARVDSSARVADGARLGADVEIGPYSVIGPDVELGDGCRIHAHVHIAGITRLGPRTAVFPFASLGTPPQSVRYRGGPTRLMIGADCIVREHVTMNTGTEDGGMETQVGDRCFIMAGAHVAHDCKIGNDVLLVNQVIMGGHCEIGEHAVLSGGTTLHPFVHIGAYSILGGMTGSIWDIPPFIAALGVPAEIRGINAVGMRRRGFSADAVRTVRAAYKMLFAGEGPPKQRVSSLLAAFPGDANVRRIVEFVRAGKRPLLQPRRGGRELVDEEEI
jgi:UDP-N-acetylglucosamine acyltransferase